MRALWLTTVTALPLATCDLLAAEIDESFLPAMAYMACAVSPDTLTGEAQDRLCSAVRGVCRDKPGSADCETLLSKFRVRELAEDNSFVLYTAASVGNVPIVTAMLAEGADPNAPLTGQAGWTPLMIAAADGYAEAVAALLAAGSDPNHKNDQGRTALMFASSYGFIAVMGELLEHGADPNIVPTDDTGWTALIAAACAGRVEAAQLLLERGADAAVKDRYGTTALACAEQRRHRDVVRLFRAQTPKR